MGAYLNTLNWEQIIVILFLFIEVALITLLILGSFAARFWLIINSFNQKKKIKAIENYFNNKNLKQVPPYKRNLDLIFSVLKKTKSLTDQEKSLFVRTHLLDQCRQFINSKNFVKRYYLIECYDYFITTEDKEPLNQLIQDSHQIITLNAIRLTGRLVDSDLYKTAINLIASFDWTTQKLYIAQLPRNEVLLQVIKHYLEGDIDLKFRQLCYEIALHCGSSKELYQQSLIDVEKTTGDCQLAAIRVMALSDPQQAKNKLFQLLKNNNWLIRNAVIQSLTKINIPESIDLLAQCLNDESYWVRVNSTKGLINFGEEGRLLLTEYLASEEARYHSLASYFLDIHKIKEQL